MVWTRGCRGKDGAAKQEKQTKEKIRGSEGGQRRSQVNGPDDHSKREPPNEGGTKFCDTHDLCLSVNLSVFKWLINSAGYVT